MSALSYNGGACLAMKGNQCVAIACDTRFGVQQQTVSFDFNKVFRMNDRIFVGMTGLGTDVQSLSQLLRYRLNLYSLTEEREMKVKTFGHLLSHMLYEKRFSPYFVEPIVAGLDENNEPYLTEMDLIGAGVDNTEFVVTGTCTPNLYGLCEAMYRPNLEPEELFETVSQCLLSAVDRDALSGWGANVYIITPDNIISRKLKSRQD